MVNLPTPDIKLRSSQQQWNRINPMLSLKLLNFQKESEFELLSIYAGQSKLKKKSL